MDSVVKCFSVVIWFNVNRSGGTSGHIQVLPEVVVRESVDNVVEMERRPSESCGLESRRRREPSTYSAWSETSFGNTATRSIISSWGSTARKCSSSYTLPNNILVAPNSLTIPIIPRKSTPPFNSIQRSKGKSTKRLIRDSSVMALSVCGL